MNEELKKLEKRYSKRNYLLGKYLLGKYRDLMNLSDSKIALISMEGEGITRDGKRGFMGSSINLTNKYIGGLDFPDELCSDNPRLKTSSDWKSLFRALFRGRDLRYSEFQNILKRLHESKVESPFFKLDENQWEIRRMPLIEEIVTNGCGYEGTSMEKFGEYLIERFRVPGD